MADFSRFLPLLLRFEGGFVDNPADPGGATNKGVTLKTFRSCAQDLLDLEPTLDHLKQLSDAQAGVIYKTLYWDPAGGDGIALQDLADIVVDFSVNAGHQAFRLLQRVLNGLGARPPLAEDGSMGPATRAALLAADPVQVYRRYRQGRIAYYQDLVREHPGLQPFLKGWLNRVAAFPER
jgi:lysozyme family protein